STPATASWHPTTASPSPASIARTRACWPTSRVRVASARWKSWAVSAARRRSTPTAGSGRSHQKCSAEAMRCAGLLAIVLGLADQVAWAQSKPNAVLGDAIPQAVAERPGDAARGRAIVANRSVGLCLLCHSGPLPEERFQGTLAPSLAGAGTRWTEGQLRLRI